MNKCVFKFYINCSKSTSGSRKSSGSEFLQTVGPATEKVLVPYVLRLTN